MEYRSAENINLFLHRPSMSSCRRIFIRFGIGVIFYANSHFYENTLDEVFLALYVSIIDVISHSQNQFVEFSFIAEAR